MGVSNSDGEVPKKPPIRIDCSPTNYVRPFGNHIGCMLKADAYVRYCRLRGRIVIYLCGTDKYGTATETKALEEKCSPKEIFHEEVYKWLDVVFDESGRILTQQQSEVDQAIFNKLLENNRLSEKTMQQICCDTCKSFLADHVGDHCEKCGSILNPTKLKDRRCKVVFPLSLLGTGENLTLMKSNSDTEYLNCEGGKLRKSKGTSVSGNDAKDTNLRMNPLRYGCLSNLCEVLDTSFAWADLQAKPNSKLLDNSGKFIYRVLSFIAKPSGQGYDSIIPDAPHHVSDFLTENLLKRVGKHVEQYNEAMEKVKLQEGLKLVRSISSEGNAYLQESQYWKLFNEDESRCAIVMNTSVGLVYLLACLSEPFIPSFSLEVLKQLNLPPGQLSLAGEKEDIDWAKRPWWIVPSGHRIGKPEQLFKESKDEEVRFAGSQADRIERAEAEAEKGAGQLKKAKVSDNSGKKQKSTKSENSTKPATEPEISIGVGLTTKAQKHPDANALNVEEDDVDELPAPLPSVHEGLSGSNPSSFGKESVHSDENDSPLADLSNLSLYCGSSTPESYQFKGIVDLVTSPADEVSRTEPQPSLRAPGSSQQLSGGPQIGACSLEGVEAVRPMGKTLKAMRRAKLPGPVRGRGPVRGARKDLDAMRCAKLPGPVRKGGMGGKGKDMNLLFRMKPHLLPPQTPESQDFSPSDASSSPGDVEFECVDEKSICGDNGDIVRVTWYKCSQDGCPAKKRRLTVHEADASSIKSTKTIYRGTHEH